MNKINKEMRDKFIEACQITRSDPQHNSLCILSKQNRVIAIEKSHETKVFLYFHNNIVAIYSPVSNSLLIDTCGYRFSPTTRAVINSILPAGYRLSQQNYTVYFTFPKGEYVYEDKEII